MKALDRESRKKLKGRFAEGSTLFCLQERSQERGHGSCVQVYHAGGGPRREAGGRALLHPGGGVLGTATSCPLAFESAGSGVVTFRARGQEFRIVLLAESRPLTETNSQDAVLVRVGPLSKGLKATFHHGDKTTHPPQGLLPATCSGAATSTRTPTSRSYTLPDGVSSSSTTRTGSPRSTQTPSAAGLRLVSVSCWKKAASFKGLFLKCHIPPSSIFICLFISPRLQEPAQCCQDTHTHTNTHTHTQTQSIKQVGSLGTTWPPKLSLLKILKSICLFCSMS